MSHNPAEVFFSEQEGSGDPAHQHVAVTPTADVAGAMGSVSVTTNEWFGGNSKFFSDLGILPDLDTVEPEVG